MSTTYELLALAAIVTAAFAVEAAMGFGATIITVAAASGFIPIDRLLPIFLPASLVLSAFIVLRWRAHVAFRLLAPALVPILAGLPVGMFLFRSADERILRLALGAFVIAVSALEIGARGDAARDLPPGARAVLLGVGGVVHGAFASGGPLVVYVLGRRLAGDKAAFRATLSLLWLLLSSLLVASYALDGSLTAASLGRSALLLPALGAGLVVGQTLHGRASPVAFRRAVFGLLLVVGVAIVARAL